MAAAVKQKLDQVGWSVSGGRISDPQHCCVLARNDLRASTKMRYKQRIRRGARVIVAQTLGGKALGGGTPAVHHAS